MECDVHPDAEDTHDEECHLPPALTALRCDSIAPPELEWFHGYLDRPEAEHLLSKEDPGTYIVRFSIPSSDQPTKYILSVRTNYGYQHFKIKTVLGEYYINVYKFPTLGSIIGYFSQVSPLLTGLYLKSPLSPKRTVSREKRLKAKASYTPSPEEVSTDVLSFKKGDIFITDDILNGDNCKWIRGRKEETSQSGLIMRVLVQEIPQDDELHQYEWFHGRVSDAAVISILRHEDEGRYVITNSGTNNYCMHVKSGTDIKSTHIYPQSDGTYVMASQSHDSIPQCIESRRKTIGNLSPVKKKSLKNISYSISSIPYQDDKIHARWRQHNTKEWKSIKIDMDQDLVVFFSLDKKGGEKHIPLKYCRVYEVDRSVFNQPHCLQVVVSGYSGEVQRHFLAVDTKDAYQELLSKLTVNEYPDRGPTPPGKRVKYLRVKVCHVDSPVNVSGPVFCALAFDGATVHHTKHALCTNKLCWNEVLHCKHRNIRNSSELKVKFCYTKNKKVCEVNAASVPLDDLGNMTFLTRYYPLPIKGLSSQAKLKLELYYREHVVLHASSYEPLISELHKRNFQTIKHLRDLHWSPEARETFASVLLTVYDQKKLLKELVSDEIARHPENDSNTIFRENNLITALLRAFLNSSANVAHFESVFASIVNDIQSRISMARQECGTLTEEKLRQIVQEEKGRVLVTLTSSIRDMPGYVRTVVSHLLESLAARWPEHATIQSAVLLTVMFVRFYLLWFEFPPENILLPEHLLPETVQAMRAIARSIKRRDITGYLEEFLRLQSSGAPETADQEDISRTDATDCAHLFNLISNVVKSTPENIVKNSDESFASLRQILDALQLIEESTEE